MEEIFFMMRGIRGAASVATNTKEDIGQTARTLVTKILSMNNLKADDIGAIIFSSTKDLTAGFPSTGLRQLKGFRLVPLFDAQETEVEGSLPMCIRVLLLVETDLIPENICHIYLGEAQKLRPDLTKK